MATPKNRPLYVQSVGATHLDGKVNLWMGDQRVAEDWRLAQLSPREALDVAQQLISAATHLLPTDTEVT